MPHPPTHLISYKVTFFVYPMKKVLRGKYFADLEEKKQKMAEALKDVKIDMFRNF